MSDCCAVLPLRPSRYRFARALAALAITAGAAAVWAQTAPAGAAAPPPTAAKPAAQTGQPKLRSPRQMAEELVPILQRQKTPWQLYPTYEKIFADFADQEQALAVANNPTDPRAKRAEQLRTMAALLAAMGQQAKLQNDIKRGQSTAPPEKRQSTFVDAGNELARLLGEFVRLGATLPQSAAAARP
jgi:hypothetical protein